MNRNIMGDIDSSIEQLEYHDLTIFTSTLYKYKNDAPKNDQDIIRSKLAIKTIINAGKLGINLVVVDGGSCEDFLSKIRKMNNITLVEAKNENNIKSLSAGSARRMALSIAEEKYNTEFYLWMEPEKDNLVTKENIDPLIQEARTGKYDIIVPKRKSKESYPDFQAREETRANKELTSIMDNNTRERGKINNIYNGEKYDFFFGPKLFSKKVINYFLSYESGLDVSDAIIIPVLIAKKNGISVGSKEIDYKYDKTQKYNEETSPMIESVNKQGKHRRRKIIDTKRLEQYIKILEETKKQLKIKQKVQYELGDVLSDKVQ